MRVRKARIKDIPTILKLHKQLLHKDFSEFLKQDFIWSEEAWIEQEVRGSSFFRIGEDAFICLSEENNIMVISTIVVDMRKRRKGLGKKLVNYAIGRAKKRGMTKVTVGSFIEYGVEKFYLKCGFCLLPDIGNLYGHDYYDFQYNIGEG